MDKIENIKLFTIYDKDHNEKITRAELPLPDDNTRPFLEVYQLQQDSKGEMSYSRYLEGLVCTIKIENTFSPQTDLLLAEIANLSQLRLEQFDCSELIAKQEPDLKTLKILNELARRGNIKSAEYLSTLDLQHLGNNANYLNKDDFDMLFHIGNRFNNAAVNKLLKNIDPTPYIANLQKEWCEQMPLLMLMEEGNIKAINMVYSLAKNDNKEAIYLLTFFASNGMGDAFSDEVMNKYIKNGSIELFFNLPSDKKSQLNQDLNYLRLAYGGEFRNSVLFNRVIRIAFEMMQTENKNYTAADLYDYIYANQASILKQAGLPDAITLTQLPISIKNNVEKENFKDVNEDRTIIKDITVRNKLAAKKATLFKSEIKIITDKPKYPHLINNTNSKLMIEVLKSMGIDDKHISPIIKRYENFINSILNVLKEEGLISLSEDGKKYILPPAPEGMTVDEQIEGLLSNINIMVFTHFDYQITTNLHDSFTHHISADKSKADCDIFALMNAGVTSNIKGIKTELVRTKDHMFTKISYKTEGKTHSVYNQSTSGDPQARSAMFFEHSWKEANNNAYYGINVTPYDLEHLKYSYIQSNDWATDKKACMLGDVNRQFSYVSKIFRHKDINGAKDILGSLKETAQRAVKNDDINIRYLECMLTTFEALSTANKDIADNAIAKYNTLLSKMASGEIIDEDIFKGVYTPPSNGTKISDFAAMNQNAFVYDQLGNLYSMKKDYQTAADYFQKAAEEYSKTSNKESSNDSYSKAADEYFNIGSIDAYHKAIKLYSKCDATKSINSNLGACFHNLAILELRSDKDIDDVISTLWKAHYYYRLAESNERILQTTEFIDQLNSTTNRIYDFVHKSFKIIEQEVQKWPDTWWPDR